ALALQQQPKGLEHVRLIVRNQHARRDGVSDHRRLLFNWPSLRNCHKELPQSSVASHKSSVTSRQSQVVSQKSSVTSRQSRVVSHESSVTSRQSRVVSHESSVTSRQSRLRRDGRSATCDRRLGNAAVKTPALARSFDASA